MATVVIDEDRTRYGRGGADSVTSVLRDDAFDELLEDFDIDRIHVNDA